MLIQRGDLFHQTVGSFMFIVFRENKGKQLVIMNVYFFR